MSCRPGEITRRRPHQNEVDQWETETTSSSNVTKQNRVPSRPSLQQIRSEQRWREGRGRREGRKRNTDSLSSPLGRYDHVYEERLHLATEESLSLSVFLCVSLQRGLKRGDFLSSEIGWAPSLTEDALLEVCQIWGEMKSMQMYHVSVESIIQQS